MARKVKRNGAMGLGVSSVVHDANARGNVCISHYFFFFILERFEIIIENSGGRKGRSIKKNDVAPFYTDD